MHKPDGERLQKVLANAGLASRRQIENWIREGRIRINGRLAQLGDRVTTEDTIKVDGKPLRTKRLTAANENHHIILYNKPEGEIVSRKDPEGRRTIFDRLPRLPHGRWIAVGRLDINSSGLILLTTNGELANRLMHPSTQIEREYAVRVLGKVNEEMLQQLVNGVELEDGFARFEEIVDSGGEGSNHWYHVVIMEGRNREVRRLWDAVGCRVNRLKRVRFGPVILDSSVRMRHFRELTKDEHRKLLALADLKDKNFRPLPKATQHERRKSVSKPAGRKKIGLKSSK